MAEKLIVEKLEEKLAAPFLFQWAWYLPSSPSTGYEGSVINEQELMMYLLSHNSKLYGQCYTFNQILCLC